MWRARNVCGADAPASGRPSELEIYWHVDGCAQPVPDSTWREHCLFEAAAGLAREGVMGGGEGLDRAGFDTAKAASMTRAACRTRRIALSGPLNAARRGPGGDRYSGHSRPLRGSAKFFCCNWGGVAQLVRAAES